MTKFETIAKLSADDLSKAISNYVAAAMEDWQRQHTKVRVEIPSDAWRALVDPDTDIMSVGVGHIAKLNKPDSTEEWEKFTGEGHPQQAAPTENLQGGSGTPTDIKSNLEPRVLTKAQVLYAYIPSTGIYYHDLVNLLVSSGIMTAKQVSSGLFSLKNKGLIYVAKETKHKRNKKYCRVSTNGNGFSDATYKDGLQRIIASISDSTLRMGLQGTKAVRYSFLIHHKNKHFSNWSPSHVKTLLQMAVERGDIVEESYQGVSAYKAKGGAA